MSQAQRLPPTRSQPQGYNQNSERIVKEPLPLPEEKNQPELQPAATGHLNIQVAFQQEEHIGKRKKEQQDAHGSLVVPADPARGRPACYLFALADGVSMGQAGALASRTA